MTPRVGYADAEEPKSISRESCRRCWTRRLLSVTRDNRSGRSTANEKLGGHHLKQDILTVTKSVCPECYFEFAGRLGHTQAEIRSACTVEAHIVEREGKLFFSKSCTKHGYFEDLLSDNADFTRRSEGLHRDFSALLDVDSHTAHNIVIDLTNRCDLKCYPCFMNANQSPTQHDLTIEQFSTILDKQAAAYLTIDSNILLSGGEPTLSPIFLDAVSYARQFGFHRVFAATNGIRFAQDDDFATLAKKSGLHGIYLQFDGATNDTNRHRGVSNLFDVKTKAIQNARRAGLTVTLQTTMIASLTDKHLEGIMRFALDHSQRIEGILFQPITFTGRDEHQPPSERAKKRYTLARLAADLQNSCAFDWDPLRDWLPFSSCELFHHCMGLCGFKVATPSSDLHPRHGQFSLLLQNMRTGAVVPFSAIIDAPKVLTTCAKVLKMLPTIAIRRLAAAIIIYKYSRFRPLSSIGLSFWQFLAMRRGCAPSKNTSNPNFKDSEWRLFTVSAIWFQDLFNLDLNATCRSCARVLSQDGDFTFCSYNSEVGRRNVESHWGTPINKLRTDKIYANGDLIPLFTKQPTADCPPR
jgi:uncharacterized radical SAM superfamily Fe-S cluster-containing enzyme